MMEQLQKQKILRTLDMRIDSDNEDPLDKITVKNDSV